MEKNFKEIVDSKLESMNKSKSETLEKLKEFFQGYENVINVSTSNTQYNIPEVDVMIATYVCRTSLFCTYKSGRDTTHKTYWFGELSSNEIMKSIKDEILLLLNIENIKELMQDELV